MDLSHWNWPPEPHVQGLCVTEDGAPKQAVYEALDTQLNCKVAFKILLIEYAKHADLIARLFSKARTVSYIKPPNIAPEHFRCLPISD